MTKPKIIEATALPSKQWRLNKSDLKKIGIGFLLALTGPALDFIAEAVFQIDFGSWTPVVYTLTPVIVNLLRKMAAGEKA